MTSTTNRDYKPSLDALTRFREEITIARRKTGHLQKELADALGIDAQVLSRKLHGAKRSLLTHAEVKQIIKVLADWDGITTRAEAGKLLKLMGLKAESFSELDWKSPPLDKLEIASPHTQSPRIVSPGQ
ncbi:hypothetical protein KDW_48960 [Dictyobacter vulcani]|uniref:Uncharacterized protein n=1 Tax=Dictyobacter vulcani TaxID=2607529 RepID=A0A5J4KN31_9CHLR|nr:hypothetical protein [Dictyobacter vulcani]GER90734.1 hypothetical protein KDW_48960 [Dictyobacter vulcani]